MKDMRLACRKKWMETGRMWRLRRMKTGHGPNFPAVAVVLYPKKTNEIVIGLDTYFELPLEAGTYRIQKDEVAAEFEVK